MQLIRKIVLEQWPSVAPVPFNPLQTRSISWRPGLLIPSICFLLPFLPFPSPLPTRQSWSLAPHPPLSGTFPIGWLSAGGPEQKVDLALARPGCSGRAALGPRDTRGRLKYEYLGKLGIQAGRLNKPLAGVMSGYDHHDQVGSLALSISLTKTDTFICACQTKVRS